MSRSARRVLQHAAPEVQPLDSNNCLVATLMREVQQHYDASAVAKGDAAAQAHYDRINDLSDVARSIKPESVDGAIGHLFLILDTAARVSNFEMDPDAVGKHMEAIERSVGWIIQVLEKVTGRDGRNIGREWYVSGTALDEPHIGH